MFACLFLALLDKLSHDALRPSSKAAFWTKAALLSFHHSQTPLLKLTLPTCYLYNFLLKLLS